MMSITTHVKHRVRTTGSEHQGQNSISDPDQNLGFTCIFSSGMQECYFLYFQMVAQIYKFEKENAGEKSMKVNSFSLFEFRLNINILGNNFSVILGHRPGLNQ